MYIYKISVFEGQNSAIYVKKEKKHISSVQLYFFAIPGRWWENKNANTKNKYAFELSIILQISLLIY